MVVYPECLISQNSVSHIPKNAIPEMLYPRKSCISKVMSTEMIYPKYKLIRCLYFNSLQHLVKIEFFPALR